MTQHLNTGERTAQAARGRAMGCTFFIGFGTVWLIAGLAAGGHGSASAYAGVGVACGALVGMVLLLLRRARDLPQAAPDADFEQRSKLMFRAVNIIQWVSIATAVAILGLLHLAEYVTPAIAILVGLHLFPLAGAFRHRQHLVTGALLVAWSLGVLALEPRDRVSEVAALGTGAVLLASAAWTLITCLGADASVGSAKVRA